MAWYGMGWMDATYEDRILCAQDGALWPSGGLIARKGGPIFGDPTLGNYFYVCRLIL